MAPDTLGAASCWMRVVGKVMDGCGRRTHTGGMTDRLHDHETLGFRRGCVACAQLETDLARAAKPKPETLVDANSR